MADETTTIEISVENWRWLSNLKQRPGDSFNDVLDQLREQSRQEEKKSFETTTKRDTSKFPTGADEEIKPEGVTMDAGEALFGDIDTDSQELQEEIESISVPDDLNLPGSGETYERRKQAIGTLVAFLRNEGTATRADFLQLIDPDDVGYASAESFWSNAVKGRDSLSAVDGVVSPSEGGHTWRYDPDESEFGGWHESDIDPREDR